MNSLSPTINNTRQQSSTFAAFHFSQKRISHVATVPSLSLLHLRRVGTLLGLHWAARHNLGRWEATGKLSPVPWVAFLILWVPSIALAVL